MQLFTTTMLSHSAEQQIADTANTPYEQLDFVAVALYGDAEQLAADQEVLRLPLKTRHLRRWRRRSCGSATHPERRQARSAG